MEKAHLKAALVEDDPDHAEFIKQALTDADLTVFGVQRVDCLSAAEASLRSSDYDIVLLDLGLPDVRGFDGLRRVRRQRPEIPAVVLTSNSDPSVGVEAAGHGAQDYLYKGDINARTLERVLRYAVQRQQMYLQLQRANAMLDQKNGELEAANVLLDQKNNHLAQLYETAHQFVDNVSHEFRTPLTVIKEFVTIIRDGLAGEVNDRQREFLDIANDRADDLATMVDDMLDVSKLEAGVLSVWRQQCRVSEILRHVRSALERKAPVKRVDLGNGRRRRLARRVLRRREDRPGGDQPGDQCDQVLRRRRPGDPRGQALRRPRGGRDLRDRQRPGNRRVELEADLQPLPPDSVQPAAAPRGSAWD